MEFKHEFETETGQGIGYLEGKVDPEENGTYNDAYVEWLEAELKKMRLADVSGSVLKSLHQDLKGFQEMEFLTPDVKTGLGIAIEQVERYMRNELEARQQ